MVGPLVRPRNAAATRDAILEAARDRFSRDSYDDVGLRDIAGDAGVDASLISRYFGSKDELFAATLDSCQSGENFWDGPREGFGRRIADQIVYHPKQGDKLKGMQMMLRSVGSAKASEIVQASGEERFFCPLGDWLGPPDADVRARLLGSLVMGLAISRELGNGFGLEPDQCETLRDRLAAMIQSIVDG